MCDLAQPAELGFEGRVMDAVLGLTELINEYWTDGLPTELIHPTGQSPGPRLMTHAAI